MSWLRTFVPCNPEVPKLICFPHAGGAANIFRPLATALAPHVEVIGIQYPGRQDRRNESPIFDLRVIAEQITGELAPLCLSTMAYFGHSMGAIVAYEVALAGAMPATFYASAARVPAAVAVDSGVLMSDQALVSEIVSLGATPAELLADPEVRDMVLPAVRADYRALSAYVAAPAYPLTADVHALVGDTDPRVSVEQARQWSTTTTGSFSLEVFAGGHFYLVPHVRQVADVIRSQLSELV